MISRPNIGGGLVRRIAYMSGDTVQWMRNDIGYNPPYEMTETFGLLYHGRHDEKSLRRLL